jgi:exopolysaccharide biosynthesis polyprenyl glycosylphosphotransferase
VSNSYSPAVFGIPALEPAHPSIGTWSGRLKRLFDLLAATAGLVVLAPLLLIVAAWIKLDSPGPVFFTQRRVGLGGREFPIYKFRSMVVDAEAHLARLRHLNEMDGPLFKMKDDPRITRVGRFLRRTSLDELPQLINVALGDMSLVGPRPPLPSEVEQFKPHHHEKFLVRPGITGPWQVSGRNEIADFEAISALDRGYVREWSFGLDLHLLWRTIPVVLAQRGAH